ncbi:MAG: hypothetical protein Q8K92_02370 [Leadbetterella sp.]|nr:hypothetical protein [Leadbetterella sp.]
MLNEIFKYFVIEWLKQNDMVLINENLNIINECENNCAEADVDDILQI